MNGIANEKTPFAINKRYAVEMGLPDTKASAKRIGVLGGAEYLSKLDECARNVLLNSRGNNGRPKNASRATKRIHPATMVTICPCGRSFASDNVNKLCLFCRSKNA